MQTQPHWFSGSHGSKWSQENFSPQYREVRLRYNRYLSNSDSKSFSSVKNIYSDAEVEKLECVGHIQKCIGNRLRNLKKKLKILAVEENSQTKISIAYRINMAIHSNVGDLEGMKKGVLAALFHVASS